VQFALLGAVVALSAGFGTARFFRFRRMRNDDDARLAQREADRRRTHFRGALDMELDQGPSNPSAADQR